MNSDQDSPGKVSGFRFRAGEDDLEEVAADPESESHSESLHQKIISRSKKLLNKDTSLSDSEDNSDSLKISEWWKNDDDALVIGMIEDNDLKNRPSPSRIKVSRGREIESVESSVEVEAGEEADELAPLLENVSPAPEPLTTTILSSLKSLCNRWTILTWLVPIIAATCLLNSDWWRGLVYGVCFLGLSQTLVNSLLDFLIGVPCDIQKHDFIIPDYKKLGPLRASVDPHKKRSCFNVYNKQYDPENYSVRQTRTVCLELEGQTLKLTKIKSKLSKKAHFSETDFEVDVNNFTIYDLSRCSVMLLPHGLAQKRLFSKKYPIAILLGDGALKNPGQSDEPYHAGWETFNKDSDHQNTDYVELITPALYLFARCDRDKEDWFRRLLAASAPPQDDVPVDVSLDNLDEDQNLSAADQYLLCMSKFVEKENVEIDADSTGTEWLNALINRILFDVFRSSYWVKTIQEKLQRKLSLIKLPYYVEEMQIIELDLGRNGPVIHRVSKPVIDERGLWFDLDLTHNGCVNVTIQTKLNLHKLQKGSDEKDDELPNQEKAKSPLFDNEAEDSVESSSEEEESPSQPVAPTSDVETTPKSKRPQSGFLRIVENVAQSRAFKHVVQTKVAQRVIAGVSQTKLRLHVQLDGIVGTVAVNLPPPPSDRLWYGFRGMPKMSLTASPLVGEWSVTFSRVKHWIEKKLIEEFQLLFVLPQMRNFQLPGNGPDYVPKIIERVLTRASNSDGEPDEIDKETVPEEKRKLSHVSDTQITMCGRLVKRTSSGHDLYDVLKQKLLIIPNMDDLILPTHP